VRFRLLLAALAVAAAILLGHPAVPATSFGVTVVAAAQQPESAKPHDTPDAKETSGEEHEANAGWLATIAKAVNFAILVAVLVYFLRAPLTAYLHGRISKVREDLVTAAETREAAARQLAEIEARLKALPLELENLERRGAEDIVAERARIEQAAEAERRRLLEHTQREIEMRLRIARRELLELTADLAVRIAGDRIRTSITPDDQARLVDRYAAQLQASAPSGPGARS
jgi:F-type H+-transporting ATPase subunit b